MSTNFPGALDSYTTKADNVDTILASHINNLQDAVVAIETGLYGGNSFPGSPVSNQLFYRRDLDWLCFYDGTRWLTTFELAMQVPSTIFTGSTSFALAAFRTDRAPYITRVALSYYVSTTNNGSNYWDIVWRGVNSSAAAATTVLSQNTSAGSVNTWTRLEAAASTPVPANNAILDVNITKNGSPGNLQIIGTCFYRLIVT